MSPTPAESFGNPRSNPNEIIKWSKTLDTVRKDDKIVSHTLITPKNVSFVGSRGSWKIYFIYFAAVYVK